MSELVFVYGTLKRGFYNNGILRQSDGKFIRAHITEPAFTMLNFGHFPGVSANGTTSIYGEIWEVPSLHLLDLLEGHPNFYERAQIDVGEENKAWIYLVPKEEYPSSPIIETGLWNIDYCYE